jgi:hypothetical protein
VDVAVDQARHDHAAPQIDGSIGRRGTALARGGHLGNALPVYEHGAIGNQRATIRVEDRGVLQEESAHGAAGQGTRGEAGRGYSPTAETLV